jgi:hypothetical protein
MVKTWHKASPKATPPPSLLPVVDDPVDDDLMPAPATADVPQPPVRLAVCPYCRTVSELEPGDAAPVKLMTCWRCAKHPPDLALAAPPVPEPQPAWLDAPDSDGKLVGFYGMLLLVLLVGGYVASQIWFENKARAPSATGVVSASTADERSVSQAAAPSGTPASELVLAPPSAGPAGTATPVAEPVRSQPPAPATARATARATAPAPAPRSAQVLAPAPQEAAECTPGAAALGLCTLGTPDRRP